MLEIVRQVEKNASGIQARHTARAQSSWPNSASLDHVDSAVPTSAKHHTAIQSHTLETLTPQPDL